LIDPDIQIFEKFAQPRSTFMPKAIAENNVRGRKHKEKGR
jgi:hypothetical protein